ncbi:hypothetical protein [Escherichia coli]|uniref:hypothetical protein n=1 Tax=Escherichia coli TaxID=562 RepID=UPI0010CB91BD|nr:hypothetical protein [Escherichia coli]
MLPSETMIWQPEFTDKTLSRKTGAVQHARIKGIDFILDPLRQNVTPSLSEHIDGVQSYSLISGLADALHVEPDPAPDWWEDRKKGKPRGKNNSGKRRYGNTQAESAKKHQRNKR